MPSTPSSPLDPARLAALAAAAHHADSSSEWPAASLHTLRQAGVLAWSVPQTHGGQGLDAIDLLAGYEEIASACLTTAFILSQREAAVRRFIASENSELARRWLPALARGDAFATVGLSQLTTSRQHQAPVLRATMADGAIHLDGVIPWVTGADQADVVVVGASLPDEQQILLALPRPYPGVTVEPPSPLMALAGSRTSQIRCEGVVVQHDGLLAGPAAKIMSGRPGGVGGLETSCLALGLSGSAVDFLGREAEARRDLAEIAQRFEEVRLQLRGRLRALAGQSPSPEEMVAIRVDCTQLALQATQVAMTVAKGAGFVSPHPVQRWARQALFFLVWSCPRPAAEGVIGHLLPDLRDDS